VRGIIILLILLIPACERQPETVSIKIGSREFQVPRDRLPTLEINDHMGLQMNSIFFELTYKSNHPIYVQTFEHDRNCKPGYKRDDGSLVFSCSHNMLRALRDARALGGELVESLRIMDRDDIAMFPAFQLHKLPGYPEIVTVAECVDPRREKANEGRAFCSTINDYRDVRYSVEYHPDDMNNLVEILEAANAQFAEWDISKDTQ
jgi:hypothetical protein